MNIFSTREIATGIWLMVFISFILFSPKIRVSAKEVIKVACTKKLVIPFLLMLLYATVIVYFFNCLPFWKWIYLKDIIIWVLFVGVSLCFEAVKNPIQEHYFFNMIIDNLKFTVIVQFIVSAFTFSLIAELLIIPAFTFLFMLDAVAGMKSEFSAVKKLLSGIIALVGFIFLYFTFNEGLEDYQSIGLIDSLISFSMPIVLSALYLPVAYLFAIYAKYEIVFIRMSFKERKDKTIQRKHRWQVVKICRLSYNKISRFEQAFIKNMYITMKQLEFDELIKRFKINKL